MKRTLSVVLALVLALSVASAALALDKDADPAMVLAKSDEATNKAKSFEAKMSMQLSLGVGGEKLDITAATDMRYFVKPQKMYVKSTVSMLGEDPIVAEVYVMPSGKDTMLYVSDGKDWSKVKSPVDISAMVTQYSGMELNKAKNLYQNLSLVIEPFRGKDIYRVNGFMDIKSAMSLAASILDADTAALLDTDLLKAFDSPIAFSMGVDPNTYLPLYIVMDMTALMRNMLTTLDATGDDIAVDKVLVQATYFNFNKARSVTLPAAAKRAKAQ